MLATQEYCDVGLTHDDAATIVAVSGEVDLFAAPRLAAALEQATQRPEPTVVDLSGCTFFDSAGLNALLGADLEARRDGRAIALACCPDGPAARVLEITAPGHFVAHATRDDALGAVAHAV